MCETLPSMIENMRGEGVITQNDGGEDQKKGSNEIAAEDVPCESAETEMTFQEAGIDEAQDKATPFMEDGSSVTQTYGCGANGNGAPSGGVINQYFYNCPIQHLISGNGNVQITNGSQANQPALFNS